MPMEVLCIPRALPQRPRGHPTHDWAQTRPLELLLGLTIGAEPSLPGAGNEVSLFWTSSTPLPEGSDNNTTEETVLCGGREALGITFGTHPSEILVLELRDLNLRKN